MFKDTNQQTLIGLARNNYDTSIPSLSNSTFPVESQVSFGFTCTVVAFVAVLSERWWIVFLKKLNWTAEGAAHDWTVKRKAASQKNWRGNRIGSDYR